MPFHWPSWLPLQIILTSVTKMLPIYAMSRAQLVEMVWVARRRLQAGLKHNVPESVSKRLGVSMQFFENHFEVFTKITHNSTCILAEGTAHNMPYQGCNWLSWRTKVMVPHIGSFKRIM